MAINLFAMCLVCAVLIVAARTVVRFWLIPATSDDSLAFPAYIVLIVLVGFVAVVFGTMSCYAWQAVNDVNSIMVTGLSIILELTAKGLSENTVAVLGLCYGVPVLAGAVYVGVTFKLWGGR